MRSDLPGLLLASIAAVATVACGSSPTPAPQPPTAGSGPAVPVASTGPLTEAEFKALHAAPTDGPATREGQRIDLAGTQAYLSLPKGPGPHPGIIVIHEWWGLNANIEHWADRLASAGWAALAVDLYGGKVATTPDDAMAQVKAVVADADKAIATLAAAHAFLVADPRIRAPKQAVIGWCFGGSFSLQAAISNPELDGAIIYYGRPVLEADKLKPIRARILGVFGARDQGIPPETVDAFEAALTQAGVQAQFHRYDADHAFANPSNPHYDEAAAADAWDKVLAFLGSL